MRPPLQSEVPPPCVRCASHAGVTLVGPKAFRLVLHQMGVKDEVLIRRIFDEFSTRFGGRRIDYRDLMRSFVCFSATSPIDEKLVRTPLERPRMNLT